MAGYIGHVGIPEYDFYQGVFYDRSKVDFRDITDGASNTLLFGEATGDTRSFAWMGVGVLAAGYGLDPNSNPQCWAVQFSSGHAGVVQFCLADGSVHSLSTEIDFQLFVNLSAIADSAVVQVP